jgi:hypothetical protein
MADTKLYNKNIKILKMLKNTFFIHYFERIAKLLYLKVQGIFKMKFLFEIAFLWVISYFKEKVSEKKIIF